MEWIDIKEEIPGDGEVVLIETKHVSPFFCLARFVDNIITNEGEYRNTFFVLRHPRFPKHWIYSSEYIKISRLHKSKILRWMRIPFEKEVNQELI